MSTVELANGEKIQRRGKKSDPRSPADRMKEQVRSVHIRQNDRRHCFQNQRHTKNNIRIRIENERWNHASVQHAIGKRWQGKEKSNQRAGGAHVEQGAR